MENWVVVIPQASGKKLDKTEKDLASKIKQSARYKIPTLTQWYLDQLGDYLTVKQAVTVDA